MINFLVKRFIRLVIVIWVTVTVIYFTMMVIPGDPIRAIMGMHGSPEVVARIKKSYGLDKPLYRQYLVFISKVIRGNLGYSYKLHRPVRNLIFERFPATFKLALFSIIMASFGGILLGLISAIFKGKWQDRVILLLSLFGISTPVFWLGIILIYFFAIKINLFPLMGYGDNGDIYHLFLPSITLALILMGFITRLMRSSALEEISSEYMTAARARGVSRLSLYGKHLLRNASLPVMTVIGLEFAGLLGGAVATEYIFAWPGIGSLLLDAIRSRDIPLIEGGIIFLSFVYILMNFIVDILYTVLNPRIKVMHKTAETI